MKSNKSDAADAAAIWEASQRPGMRFVAVKTEDQQAMLAMHRIRQKLVRDSCHADDLTALTDAPLDVNGHRNALRDAANEFFTTRGGEWEVRVQLATDIDRMPVEDASAEWPEDESPYIASRESVWLRNLRGPMHARPPSTTG